MFEWSQGNYQRLIVTCNQHVLTLNSHASDYLKNARYCAIGINKKDGQLAIKPISKEDIDLNLVDVKHLYKINFGQHYARISNKSIINDLENMVQQNPIGLKFNMHYDQSQKMLIANCTSPIEKEVD